MNDNQLIISKYNHATIKIQSSQSIALELSDSFKFFVSGYKFSPKYKSGQWDGSIRLFNLGTRTMGSGLYTHVLEFANNREYEVLLQDSEEYGAPDYEYPITYEETSSYMESLDLHGSGEKITIRDYQINGVFQALSKRTGILNAVTGAGKSLMLYCILRYLTEELNIRVLLIVPTVTLTTQMRADFIDYSSANGYDVDKNVHLISAGIDKDINKPIVISTFQSLKDISADWLNSFGGIITDEGHKIVADSFKQIYGKSTEVPYRLACTGTLHDTKCDLLQLQSLTGKIHVIATAKDLIAAGQLVSMKIKAITLNYSKDICKLFKKIDYDDEITWLTTNPKRNTFIRKLAIQCSGTTLVMFRYTDHGKLLYNEIKEYAGERQVYYIDGGVSKEDREIIRLAANSEDAILVCSYGSFSTGVNVPAIENVIIAHPIKSKLTYFQSIGRGLRLKAGKTFCRLFDIGDNLTWKKKTNHTYEHFSERMRLLLAEGYTFDDVYVNF